MSLSGHPQDWAWKHLENIGLEPKVYLRAIRLHIGALLALLEGISKATRVPVQDKIRFERLYIPIFIENDAYQLPDRGTHRQPLEAGRTTTTDRGRACTVRGKI